jgi:hypothetical protein
MIGQARLEVRAPAQVVPGVPVWTLEVEQVFGRPRGYADLVLDAGVHRRRSGQAVGITGPLGRPGGIERTLTGSYAILRCLLARADRELRPVLVELLNVVHSRRLGVTPETAPFRAKRQSGRPEVGRALLSGAAIAGADAETLPFHGEARLSAGRRSGPLRRSGYPLTPAAASA